MILYVYILTFKQRTSNSTFFSSSVSSSLWNDFSWKLQQTNIVYIIYTKQFSSHMTKDYTKQSIMYSFNVSLLQFLPCYHYQKASDTVCLTSAAVSHSPGKSVLCLRCCVYACDRGLLSFMYVRKRLSQCDILRHRTLPFPYPGG